MVERDFLSLTLSRPRTWSPATEPADGDASDDGHVPTQHNLALDEGRRIVTHSVRFSRMRDRAEQALQDT
jgi:hypothetical protein